MIRHHPTDRAERLLLRKKKARRREDDHVPEIPYEPTQEPIPTYKPNDI